MDRRCDLWGKLTFGSNGAIGNFPKKRGTTFYSVIYFANQSSGNTARTHLHVMAAFYRTVGMSYQSQLLTIELPSGAGRVLDDQFSSQHDHTLVQRLKLHSHRTFPQLSSAKKEALPARF